jgi:2-methylcitrate dehydratase PrpD
VAFESETIGLETASMTRTVAVELGEFLSALRLPHLPPTVVEKAEICVLDAVGMALEGFRLEPVRLAIETAVELSPRGGPATVWGAGQRVDALLAAFANCVAIHALLHDDTLMDSWSHPAGPVVAAAFAAAQHAGASGAETLVGIVAGYEVMARLGGEGAIAFEGIRRGFRANSTYGVFGAAAAAASILGLGAVEYAHTLACAASFANGLIEPLHAGSMEWRHETGVAAQNGVLAAFLARRGLRAATTAFEGQFGFWRAFGGATERPASATAELGKSFAILEKTFHKPYPTASEYTWNSAMYVTHRLVSERSIDYRDVESIEVTVMTRMLSYPGLGFAGPFENIDQAIASKPFAIAAIMRTHGFTSDVYANRLRDPDILALAGRVSIRGADDWEGWRCHVQIRLRDGRVHTGDERMVDRAIFYPDREGITTKFKAMVADVIPAARASAIASATFELDRAAKVEPFVNLLTVNDRE